MSMKIMSAMRMELTNAIREHSTAATKVKRGIQRSYRRATRSNNALVPRAMLHPLRDDHERYIDQRYQED